MTHDPPLPECTEDAFLDGRLKVLQPRRGFRAGIDSLLLAAAVPARVGDVVFEAGCGPGVAALALLARVPGCRVVALEAEPAHAALARENARRNRLEERLEVHLGDALRAGKADDAARLRPGSFDHAFANPPFFEAAAALPPADESRAAAHLRRASLKEWIAALLRMVRPKRGTITVIQPAAALPQLLAALLELDAGAVAIFPLWPRAGRPASRVIVQARRGVKVPPCLLPGLILHKADNAFTEEAEALLRAGGALNLHREG